jgi:REP element-mobilizing transposase RayT
MIYDSDKYHRRSIRLKGYDYSQAGYYFLTICARNRECIFAGSNLGVKAGLAPALISIPNSFPIFHLTKAGNIIEKNWRDIEIKYNHVTIDNFVIMPNHFHGILIMDRKNRAPSRDASTLGQIIGSFKSKCVIDYMKYCLEKNDEEIWKIWQRNYYEHIICDEKELNQIRQCILENPAKWLEDEDNPINIENDQRLGHPQGAGLAPAPVSSNRIVGHGKNSS